MANVLDTRIPMMGQPVNALGSFVGGAQAAQAMEANALDMKTAQTDQRIKAAQMLAQGVLSSDDPASAYRAALPQAQQLGFDISGFPEEYDDGAETFLRMVLAPNEDRTGIERLIGDLPENERMDAIRSHLGILQKPELRSVGGDLVEYTPGSGEAARTVHSAPEKADHPANVDEYLFAAENGFEGTFADWMQGKGKPDIRNDPQGVPRYVGSAEPVFPGIEPKQAKPSAMQEKIDLLTAQGVDQETATAIATGRYTTSRDPVTGQAQIVDKASGRVVGQMPAATGPSPAGRGAPGGPPPASAQQGQPRGSLYDKAGEATGVVPGMQELATDTLGQLPGVLGEQFQFPETVEDRQALRTAAGNLVRALSVNPRMPVAEIERIRDQIRIEPGPMISGEGLRSRMRSIDESLRRNIEAQRGVAADQSMPPEARRSAAENIAAMETFLSDLGVPVDAGPRAANTGKQGGNVPRPASERDYQALPPGSVYMAPDGTTRRKP